MFIISGIFGIYFWQLEHYRDPVNLPPNVLAKCRSFYNIYLGQFIQQQVLESFNHSWYASLITHPQLHRTPIRTPKPKISNPRDARITKIILEKCRQPEKCDQLMWVTTNIHVWATRLSHHSMGPAASALPPHR